MSLPATYFVAAGLFLCLLAYGMSRLRRAWSVPYIIAVCTIAAWYLVEPWYFSPEFAKFDPGFVDAAYLSVVIFFIAFAIVTPILVRRFRPVSDATTKLRGNVSADSVLLITFVVWAMLLAYGTYRMGGDLLGALFPIGGRSAADMWSRAAGAAAGPSGFMVSTAAYVYTVCLAMFGVLLTLAKTRRAFWFSALLILISWPYVFLQGARNVVLAVAVPGMCSFLLYSRRSVLTKAAVFLASFVALDFVFRIIIVFRNEGFTHIDLSSVGEAQHLGLNMASELIYCHQFLEFGVLDRDYGLRYLQELLNFVPRAIWPDKPMIGIDYAIARGFGGTEADIGVFATISTGIIGQGVLSFGPWLGPVVAAALFGGWVAILARFRVQHTPLRQGLFLIGAGLTFNLGRDLTLLVLWPIIFAFVGVRLIERSNKRVRYRA